MATREPFAAELDTVAGVDVMRLQVFKDDADGGSGERTRRRSSAKICHHLILSRTPTRSPDGRVFIRTQCVTRCTTYNARYQGGWKGKENGPVSFHWGVIIHLFTRPGKAKFTSYFPSLSVSKLNFPQHLRQCYRPLGDAYLSCGCKGLYPWKRY